MFRKDCHMADFGKIARDLAFLCLVIGALGVVV